MNVFIACQLLHVYVWGKLQYLAARFGINFITISTYLPVPPAMQAVCATRMDVFHVVKSVT
jgi:hypothetical protein